MNETTPANMNADAIYGAAEEEFAFRKTTTRIAKAIFNNQKGNHWNGSKRTSESASTSASSYTSGGMSTPLDMQSSSGTGIRAPSSISSISSSAIPSALPSRNIDLLHNRSQKGRQQHPKRILSLKDRLGTIGTKESTPLDEELNPNLKNPLHPLTEQQIITFSEIFSFYADQNLTGAVPIETLPELFYNCGLFFVQESLRQKYLKKFSDRFGDFIELDEFLKICAKQMTTEKRQVSKETLKEAFTQIFDSRHGIVEVSELKFVLKHLGEPLQEHEVENMLNMIPIEQGKVDIQTFINFLLEID